MIRVSRHRVSTISRALVLTRASSCATARRATPGCAVKQVDIHQRVIAADTVGILLCAQTVNW